MTSASAASWTLALTNSPTRVRRLAVIGAPALTGPAWTVADQVQAACDDLRDAAQLPRGVRTDRIDHVLTDADLVWLALPRSLAALDEAAEATAARGSDQARMVVIGRDADMSRSMNQVLAKHFAAVHASRGVGKLRALVGEGPIRPARLRWPQMRHLDDLDLDVWAHGVTFAGGRLDQGTRALIRFLGDVPRGDVLDFGSGSGILAALLARRPDQPSGGVQAIDVLLTSIDATMRTAASAGVEVRATWADGLDSLAPDSLDAIVTNPPFHRGTAKDSSATLAMFTDAARVLRPGGQLWAVFNSHLPWKSRLSHLVGPTRLVAQDPRYTVVVATRA